MALGTNYYYQGKVYNIPSHYKIIKINPSLLLLLENPPYLLRYQGNRRFIVKNARLWAMLKINYNLYEKPRTHTHVPTHYSILLSPSPALFFKFFFSIFFPSKIPEEKERKKKEMGVYGRSSYFNCFVTHKTYIYWNSAARSEFLFFIILTNHHIPPTIYICVYI